MADSSTTPPPLPPRKTTGGPRPKLDPPTSNPQPAVALVGSIPAGPQNETHPPSGSVSAPASTTHPPQPSSPVPTGGTTQQDGPFENADNCSVCSSKFTITKRPAHCRRCNASYCKKCAPPKADYGNYGYGDKPVRLCQTCLLHYMTCVGDQCFLPPKRSAGSSMTDPNTNGAAVIGGAASGSELGMSASEPAVRPRGKTSTKALKKGAHEPNCTTCGVEFNPQRTANCLCLSCACASCERCKVLEQEVEGYKQAITLLEITMVTEWFKANFTIGDDQIPDEQALAVAELYLTKTSPLHETWTTKSPAWSQTRTILALDDPKAAIGLLHLTPQSDEAHDALNEILASRPIIKSTATSVELQTKAGIKVEAPPAIPSRPSPAGKRTSNSRFSVNTSETKVFGQSLKHAVHLPSAKDGLPAVVVDSIAYLDVKGIKEEGIYRMCGSVSAIQKLKLGYDMGMEIDLNEQGDPNVIAGLFKQYLRELPHPLLLSQSFSSQDDLQDVKRKLETQIPPENLRLISALCRHLHRLSKYSDVTKMTTFNLGICFCPTLQLTDETFAVLVDNAELLFGSDVEL